MAQHHGDHWRFQREKHRPEIGERIGRTEHEFQPVIVLGEIMGQW
jgi:hypothetical protein